MDRNTKKDLARFESHHKDTKPKLKDLYQYITPKYATQWKEIGTLLDLSIETLKIIEHDNNFKAEKCCNAMLDKWLQVDTNASWGKLITVIKSPAVSSGRLQGVDAVSILSDMVSKCNVREQFNDEETWPPDQQNNFTPLVLIHHQGEHTMKEVTAKAQLIQKGSIDEITSLASNQSFPKDCPELDSHDPLQVVLDNSTVTKELKEVLAPLEQSKDPQFILIEGAPGIGKSVLLKEIAYGWGNKQLLETFQLVLLVCLRDPTVQNISSINHLLYLFCTREDTRATQISIACSNHFVQNDGRGLVFLFDGFDEYPEALQKNSLIADILKRKVLPNCALVVSSRPHATVHLRKRATVRVDILGFTETERNQFIEQALKDQPSKIKELTQYLADNFTISNLCVVPFNMVVLLFLYKQEGISLPNNSTELYNHFICITLCRHLAKHGHCLDNTINDLTKLPDPYNKIIQQLSRLSLEALDNDKLVFTHDEIKEYCPDIAIIPEAINGFGLLQAVQHYGVTGKTMSFHFLHFSIQEFLAAYRVASLSPSVELKILTEKFWSDTHSNMFAMYVTLTKGQRPSFKTFIKPSLGQRFKGVLKGKQVENRFLKDKVKCFHLFRCFFEAGDKEMCKSIEEAKPFNSKTIEIAKTRLSASDVECVTVFLSCSSYKEWKTLNLNKCDIQDNGLQTLHRGLISCDVTFMTLELRKNGLTKSSSSAISDITINCRVKQLNISGNKTVGEHEKLYSIISDPTSMLEVLYINSTKLSSNAAIKLFTALSEGKKLKVLGIAYNNINDEACDAITLAMQKTSSLVELYMHANPISGKSIQLIVQALQLNNTLKLLYLRFDYPEDVKRGIRLSVEKVNKKRESCQKLEIKFW